jgi:hypothetical protein
MDNDTLHHLASALVSSGSPQSIEVSSVIHNGLALAEPINPLRIVRGIKLPRPHVRTEYLAALIDEID